MPLSPLDQLDAATTSISTGDLDLLSRMLTDPDTITTDDQRTVAERLGYKRGFLAAGVNLVLDPTVWVAMALSRAFPTAQFLKGTVPTRLIGTSAEFSGISTATRTVEGFFRGTNVPNLIALKMKREADVMKIGNSIFDEIALRPNWNREMPLVSQILEGQSPVGASSELYDFAGRIRGHMDEMWKFLSRTQKVTGGFDEGALRFAKAGPFPAGEAPRYLRDYLPHIPLYVNESTIEVSGQEALKRLGGGKMAQVLSLAGERPDAVWRSTRGDRLVSEYGAWQRFMERTQAQVFNPRLFRRERMGIPLQSAEGQGLFITDLNVLLQKYVHGVARTYSLNAPLSAAERAAARSFIATETGERVIMPTAEPIMVQILNEGLKTAGADPGRLIRRQVAGTNVVEELIDPRSINHVVRGALQTLVREVKGQADPSEALFGNLFNTIRAKTVDAFSHTGLVDRKKELEIEQAIASVQRDSRGMDAQRRVTSYFYASTLGLNPASSLKNLLQPFLTTAPSIGVGPTLAGYRVLKERLPSYAEDWIRRERLLRSNPSINAVQRLNLAQEQAFQHAFPELAESGIKADPRLFELSEGLVTRDVTGGVRFKSYDAYMKFLLQPFTQTEMSNQIVSFYGGKDAIRRAIVRGEMDIPTLPTGEALSGAELDQFLNLQASNIVNATQFRPGPGSRSVLQTMIPAPFRMFTSFPLRLANFFADSTVRGALTNKQIEQAGVLQRLTGGRNLGTLARTYVMGRTITEGARQALGVDLADAVGLTGPFSGVVSSGRLLSPMTFSPLPAAVISMASFASTRDLRDVNPMELPGGIKLPIPKTLFPGGVAISRASRVWRSFRPDLGGFVDEDERLMFEGDASDAALGMLGIPLDKERRMREAVDRMQANRQAVSGFRRRYAVAVRNFDTREMAKLERKWADAFPGHGPLGVSSYDVTRYNEQSNLTSVQRSLRSLGRNFGYLENNIYQADPDLIGPSPTFSPGF